MACTRCHVRGSAFSLSRHPLNAKRLLFFVNSLFQIRRSSDRRRQVPREPPDPQPRSPFGSVPRWRLRAARGWTAAAATCGAPSRSGTSSTLSTSTLRRRSPMAAASPPPRPARTPPASRSPTAARTSRSPTPSSWIRRTLGISSRWGGLGCSSRKMTAPTSILLSKQRSS